MQSNSPQNAAASLKPAWCAMHTSAAQSSCPTAKSFGAFFFVCVVFSKLWQLAAQKELLLKLLFLLWPGVSSPPRLLQPQLHSVGSEMSVAPMPEQKFCWGRQLGVFQLQRLGLLGCDFSAETSIPLLSKSSPHCFSLWRPPCTPSPVPADAPMPVWPRACAPS